MHFAQALFFLNAGLWLVMGVTSIFIVWGSSPGNSLIAWIIAILMLGNAAAMLLSGVLIARPGRPGYYFALAVLLVNIVLTFTDQFGALDLITLLIDLLLLALLVAWRKRFLQPSGVQG